MYFLQFSLHIPVWETPVCGISGQKSRAKVKKIWIKLNNQTYCKNISKNFYLCQNTHYFTKESCFRILLYYYYLLINVIILAAVGISTRTIHNQLHIYKNIIHNFDFYSAAVFMIKSFTIRPIFSYMAFTIRVGVHKKRVQLVNSFVYLLKI